MARPQKEGIDYFPLDVKMDDEIKLIEAKFNVAGFGILIKLYQIIYDNSYYIKWTERELLLYSNRINADINLINEVVIECLKWNIFDKDLYEKFEILTSKGIQKRYIEATQRRKDVSFFKEYLLVNLEEKYQERVNVNINEINADINSEKEDISTQSKLKESKVKNTKVNNNSFLSDSTEYRLSEFLFKYIKKNNEDTKEPNFQTWAKHFDYILRIDKRNLEEVKLLIKFCQMDSFWLKNILSPSKLREKYDRLILEMKDKKKGGGKTGDDKGDRGQELRDQGIGL